MSRSSMREWRDRGIEPSARTSAPCFRCSDHAPPDPPAYALLFGFYLGDGCISEAARAFVLRISCDTSYPGIVATVARAIEQVAARRPCLVSAPGCTVVQSGWKHWPCLFPQHGPGRKHERPLRLAPWQRVVVEDHPADFLRGLLHSDGCRVNNWATRVVAGRQKRYDYARWMFTNNSADIRQWCTDTLDLLGIRWRQPSWKTIAVSDREGVALLDDLVGPKS